MSFSFKKNKKIIFKKGMTYVELIVVMSIFSIMSAITLIDYGKFQAKVDIKNLSNDIALQIVGAQKNAMAGKLPIGIYNTSSSWKPAHGVHFSKIDSKVFVYFTDIDTSNTYNPNADSINCTDDGECLDRINITKGNYVSHLEVFGSSNCGVVSDSLDVVFRRPDSSALISVDGANCGYFKEALIGITSPKGVGAKIYIYPTGRIELK